MKRLLLPLIMLAIAAAGGAWWWQNRNDPPPGWQGYVDADYVRVAPTLAGQLVTLSVHRGQQVAAGAPLFAQDDTNDCAAQEQTAATLAEVDADILCERRRRNCARSHSLQTVCLPVAMFLRLPESSGPPR